MIKPQVFDNGEALHKAAADAFVSCYQNAIDDHGTFHVALSGGSTPKSLHRLLASKPFASEINWQKVHVYFGDERFVPHDHVDSNYAMARSTLLDLVEIPDNNIHPVQTDRKNAEISAADYSETLKNNLPTHNNELIFDLILLGLGPDGHTASLFPETDVLDEKTKVCAAVYVKKFESWRITITFPVINSAKVILLVSEGSGKIEIVKELRSLPNDKVIYPIQMIKPTNQMLWFIDKAADNQA